MDTFPRPAGRRHDSGSSTDQPIEWHQKPGAEQHIRYRGKWLAIGGGTVFLLAVAICVIWWAGFGHDIPLMIPLPLMAIGVGAVAISALEYLGRADRQISRENRDRIERIEDSMCDLVGLMNMELQQRFYAGAAWNAKNGAHLPTGTEHTGEVINIRTPRPRP